MADMIQSKKNTDRKTAREQTHPDSAAAEINAETIDSFFQQISANHSEAIKSLLRNIPIIIYAIANTSYIYVNSTFERITGYTLADLEGKNFWDIIHPDQRALVRDRGLARLHGEKVPLHYEMKVLTKNGETIYVDGFYGLFNLNNQSIIIVEAVDITESKLLKEALQASHDRLDMLVKQRTEELHHKNQELIFLNESIQNVLRNISDGVVTVDREGNFEILNSSFLAGDHKLLGEIGKNMKDVFVQGNMPYVKRMMGVKEPFVDQEMTLPTSKGPLNLLASGTPLLDEEGGVSRGVIMLRPIREVHRLVNRLSGAQAVFFLKDIITNDAAMLNLAHMVKQSACMMSNVLITGESGTGKELFAQAIHNESSRRKEPFLAINCAAMPRELIGSELFGYAEGAFTGARKGGKPGKFELASGGTIFLDEIGDMPIDQQGALLRVLQEKKITRIGGLRDIPIDVRVVCATNKDLSDEMRKGNFRSDLFYRLNVINIKIPPLRERPGDILLLFKHFLNDLHAPVDQSFEDIDPEVINCLLRYKWPGNVRELQNVVERMVNAMNGTTIEIENLPMEIREWRPASECPPLPNVSKNQDSDVTMDQARELGKQLSTDMEKNQIIDLLKQYGGNVSRVAREMSISRPTLYKKMRQN